MISNDLAYQLISQQYKSVYAMIELLNWNEEFIEEIQGLITTGSLSLQGDSSVRRTCSLTMTIKDGMEKISSTSNKISINKKIRLKIGVSNEIAELKDVLDEVVWFDYGVFVLTGVNINRAIESATLSITAQDKMALLTGDISGVIEGMLEVNKVASIDDNGEETLSKLTIQEMIYYAVAGLGGEDRSKIIINDVPDKIKVPVQYNGENTLYYDANGNELASSTGSVREVQTGDYAGYLMEDFYYPGDLIKQPGDTISSILDDIKNILGNFEYFYDTSGNFVFQEVKNYLNTSFTSIDKLNNGSYVPNFDKTPYVFSFREKEIVNSFSNNPNWSNIKNDFIVWGMGNEEAGPMMFHLVVDNKPATTGDIPWQQELINYGNSNLKDPGPYYGELVSKFPQIYEYDKATGTGKWKTDQNDFKYYFDMIDANSAYGEFAVSAIGKRAKVVVDDQVGRLYPPIIPDFVILPPLPEGLEPGPDGSDHPLIEERKKLESLLQSQGQKYFNVRKVSWQNMSEKPYAKDAFGVVRELLYQHTTVNNSITLTTLPLYFLDVNQRIEVYDDLSDIKGDYIIKSLSVPLNHEGLMSINAIKVLNRI